MNMSSSFDGRDLFGFDAEGTEFDTDMAAPYDISADFAVPDDHPFPSFGGFETMVPPPVDETEVVSLTYQGYVFAKRIVTVKRASDPAYPLPFFFQDDVCSLHSFHPFTLYFLFIFFCVYYTENEAHILCRYMHSSSRSNKLQLDSVRSILFWS